MQHNRIDFAGLHRQALPYLPAILRRMLPDGHVKGREYIARNPNRADQRLGSFKINLMTGKWSDFAIGISGGDVASLVAYVMGVSQSDAAAWVIRMIGRMP